MRVGRVGAAAVIGLALTTIAAPAVADPGGGEEPIEDLVAPVVTVTKPGGAVDGWYAGTIPVTVRATDDHPYATGVAYVTYDMRGAQTSTGNTPDRDGGTVSVSAEGVTTVYFVAWDGNGNQGTGAAEVRIDRTAPTITPVPGLDYAEVAQHQEVRASYSCADGAGSGVASCAGPVAAGGLVDTSTLGQHTFTVTARDKVGNTSTHTVRYTVVDDEFTVSGNPVITGTPAVGELLALQLPTISPLPAEIGYRWFRGDTFVGADPTYRVTEADRGDIYGIRAVVILQRPGVQRRDLSAFPVRVPAGTIEVDREPEIVGEPVVGGTLAAWGFTTTPTNAVRTYTWFRDGRVIEGATDPQYYPVVSDLGRRIGVRVTLTAPGYTTRTWNLESSGPVRGRALEVVGSTTVTGTPRVGSLLTARPPLVREPVPNFAAGDPARLAYQWLRDGRAIPGATARTYRLTAADAGRRLSVRVTGTVTGYEPAVGTSPTTAKVAKATPVVRATVRALGRGKARLTVRATAPGAPVTGRVTVKWGNKVVLRRALRAGALTAVLSRQPRGKVVYTVVYGGSGGVAARTVKVTARLR